MTIRKALTLLALPALLIGAEASARSPAAYQLDQASAAKPATFAAVPLPSARGPRTGCPPFACGAEGNGPALTGVRAGSDASPVRAVQLRPQGQPSTIGRWCTRVTDWWTICW